MKIDRKELLQSLAKVKPGLGKNELIEQATHFCFMGDRVVTYNDEISVSCTLENMDCHGAVSADELYSFLNRVTRDSIDINVKGSELLMKCGRASAGLTLHEQIKLPLSEIEGPNTDWIPLPDNFAEAISFCKFSCSSDMSMPILNCLHVCKECVESSDDIRFTKFELKECDSMDSFLIPVSVAKELSNYAITEMTGNSSWKHFRTADKSVVFSCRIYADEYPDTSGFSNIENFIKVKMPKKLGMILTRAGIFAKERADKDSMITITIDGSMIKIKSQNDAGWFKETTKIKYDGDPITFNVNPEFLEVMLSKTTMCLIGSDRIKFEGDNWYHIVALTMEV